MREGMPLVWVTGAAGLLGRYVVATAPQYAPGWQVVGLTRSDADLTDPAAVERRWAQGPPDVVIHCAAFGRAAQCEVEPANARAMNVTATAHLAQLASDIPFLFLSTDHVFDGRQGWYRETDAVCPLTMYGRTKVEAEEIVLANTRHTVLRTSLNAGFSVTGDRSFVEETVTAWKQGRTVRLFTDEFRCPIPAVVTAQAIWEVARVSATGLYHVAGAERLSRWDIGQLLAAHYPEYQPCCVAGSLRDYDGPPRAPDLSLDCSKIAARLTFPLPSFRAWLEAYPRATRNDLWRVPT